MIKVLLAMAAWLTLGTFAGQYVQSFVNSIVVSIVR